MWPKVGDQKISDSDWKEFLNENKTIILYKMKAAKFRKERWLKVAPMCTWRGSSYALSIEFTQYNIVVHKYNNRGPQSLNCALLFDGVGIHWNTNKVQWNAFYIACNQQGKIKWRGQEMASITIHGPSTRGACMDDEGFSIKQIG